MLVTKILQNHQLIIAGLVKKNIFGIRYTRQYLTSLDINYDLIQQQKEIEEKKSLKQAIFNLPYNDKNQKNIVKIRINHPIHSINFREPGLVKTCAVMEKQYPKPPLLVHATRKYIITSLKKARDAMHPIKKKHIFQAISICDQSPKKVAKLMTRTLWNLMDHAKHKGMIPIRLFIHGCIIGKTKRYYGVRYQAKGRGYRQQRDFCQEIADGECAPGVALFIRNTLKNNNADYKTISKFGFITTAKGRQQAKQLIRRQIDIKMAENQKNNIFVPKKQVKMDILQVQGKKVQQMIRKLFESKQDEQSLVNREKMFKKNLELNP